MSSQYRVQVLDRAVAILTALRDRPGDCSLADLCKVLGLHKSTVHRLIMVLERHRLVDKHPLTGRYRLGLKLFEFGSKAIAALDLQERARPYLRRVLEETGETVNLSVLDQGEVLYIEKMETHKNLRMAASIGHRFPAHCTALGKAILAEMPDDQVDALLGRLPLKGQTPNSIIHAAALKSELKATRVRGYAIDNEENEEGARCVGVAVRNHLGRPVASISVSGPSFRMNKAKVQLVAKSLINAGAALSADLGYKPMKAAVARVATN
jgi:DNA-binding IclR family transcriptional regulator